MMGDPVQSLSKTVHPEVAGPKLQQNPWPFSFTEWTTFPVGSMSWFAIRHNKPPSNVRSQRLAVGDALPAVQHN